MSWIALNSRSVEAVAAGMNSFHSRWAPHPFLVPLFLDELTKSPNCQAATGRPYVIICQFMFSCWGGGGAGVLEADGLKADALEMGRFDADSNPKVWRVLKLGFFWGFCDVWASCLPFTCSIWVVGISQLGADGFNRRWLCNRAFDSSFQERCCNVPSVLSTWLLRDPTEWQKSPSNRRMSVSGSCRYRLVYCSPYSPLGDRTICISKLVPLVHIAVAIAVATALDIIVAIIVAIIIVLRIPFWPVFT